LKRTLSNYKLLYEMLQYITPVTRETAETILDLLKQVITNSYL